MGFLDLFAYALDNWDEKRRDHSCDIAGKILDLAGTITGSCNAVQMTQTQNLFTYGL